MFFIIALGACVALVLFGSSNPKDEKNNIRDTYMLDQKLEDSDASMIQEPVQKDVEPYSENAVKILTDFKFWSQADSSDLPESCGVSQFPCVDKIGTCLMENLIKNSDGKITPKTQACSCFTKGYQELIEIPGRPDISITCPFHCVESILKVAQNYVSTINGRRGPPLRCKTLMRGLAREEYGNRNGAIADEGDLDSMGVLPIDDPDVTRAADAVRVLINSGRRTDCPVLPAFAETPAVVYAKRGLITEVRSFDHGPNFCDHWSNHTSHCCNSGQIRRSKSSTPSATPHLFDHGTNVIF